MSENEKCQNKDFVVGGFNKKAYLILTENFTEINNSNFNPIFIYGKPGTGKTKLVAEIISQNIPIEYLSKIHNNSIYKFTYDFIESVRGNKINEFSNCFKNYEVLIFENLEHLINKEKSQEIFLQIIKSHLELKKTILFTSLKSPRIFEEFQPELKSLLLSSICLKIKQPNFNSRIKFLQGKLDFFKVEIPQSLIGVLAFNFKGDFRVLEGVTKTLSANYFANEEPIDFKLVKKVIKERMRKEHVSNQV